MNDDVEIYYLIEEELHPLVTSAYIEAPGSLFLCIDNWWYFAGKLGSTGMQWDTRFNPRSGKKSTNTKLLTCSSDEKKQIISVINNKFTSIQLVVKLIGGRKYGNM